MKMKMSNHLGESSRGLMLERMNIYESRDLDIISRSSFLHGFVFLLHRFVAIRCLFFAYVYFFGGVWLHGLFESSLALRSHVIVTCCLFAVLLFWGLVGWLVCFPMIVCACRLSLVACFAPCLIADSLLMAC